MKNEREKSDPSKVAEKPANKPGQPGAESAEPREGTEGNMGEQHTYRTLCRIKRVPEARLCTRSCSWDSSLTTRGGSPVRESRPPGSVRGASSDGCPYRDSHHEWSQRSEFTMFNTLVLAPNVVSGESRQGAACHDHLLRNRASAAAWSSQTVYDLTAIDSHGYSHARRFSRMNRDVVITRSWGVRTSAWRSEASSQAERSLFTPSRPAF
jgi:hypothetical protein